MPESRLHKRYHPAAGGSVSHHHDVLIIGGGAAGLGLALRLPSSLKIAVIAKGSEKEGSTYFAQGGISAVLRKDDSFESHIEDTIKAGAGLCNPDVVRTVIENGPSNIDWLTDLGVPFTHERNADGKRSWHLTREGGHTHRRVIHAADATGRALQTTLMNNARSRNNIELFENHIAIDLVTGHKQGLDHNRCCGAYVLNRDTGSVESFHARFTVLASGGASKAYLYTSNPDGSTGDGIAMAWRSGCRVGNMEFVQFHPTCLYHPHAKSFLISEAVRGEGGILTLPDGTRFMHEFDSRRELAPRDIVARAIDHEMKRLGIPCVYIDISHKSRAFITSHFPNIYQRCKEYGLDMTSEPLPVVPAAHYTCGGIVTDENGATDIESLYAIGECAFTGLHGANRMASNSLLECLVFAEAAGKDIIRKSKSHTQPVAIRSWDESQVTNSDEEVVVSHNWDELRRFMWDYVGIVRTDKRLQRARRRIELLLNEIEEYYGNFHITNDLIELRNLTLVADLIVRSAMLRKESRGLHFTLTYPDKLDNEQLCNTILDPNNGKTIVNKTPILANTNS